MGDPIHAFTGDFPIQSEDDWRKLALKALKGAELESITRKTPDGLERGPLFTNAPSDQGDPGAYPYVRGKTSARDPFLPWQIRQHFDHGDLKTCNDAILSDLAGGVSQIALHVDPTGQNGTAITSKSDMAQCLNGVMLDLAPVVLKSHGSAVEIAQILADYLSSKDDMSAFTGGFGLDVLQEDTSHTALELITKFANAKIYSIDGAVAFEAGGTQAQELAWMASCAAEAMRQLIEAGLSADTAARSLEFSFAADTDIHLTIAKLRAARRIWARIAESFGASKDACAMSQHATTSARFMSAKDPWTNLIRMTCAAFGAATGGADAITVRPLSDAMEGEPTRFARRTARNIQIMLAEEAHLGKAADPSGGAYLHETLSHELAQKAWNLFQDLERTGGPGEVLANGDFAKQINETAEAHLDAYRSGEDTLIGVTQYPDPDPRKLKTNPRPTHESDVILPSPAFKPVNFAVELENKGGAS